MKSVLDKILEDEFCNYDEFELLDLRDEIIELQKKIDYAKSNLLEHMDEETILEVFGE